MYCFLRCLQFVLIILNSGTCLANVLPVVINTWPFISANSAAWSVLSQGGDAIDAVEQGGIQCDLLTKCGSSVGAGGSPDESGETTLDAMIMDGRTHDVGAVGDLRRVKGAISVARAIMSYSTETMLVGYSATAFALEMGFNMSDLHTNASIKEWETWLAKDCQPNFRINVVPDPSKNCGPYTPATKTKIHSSRNNFQSPVNENNHDTIALIAIDVKGNLASGTTTNGLTFKLPGRVGDSTIAGAGSYVDNDIGGAGATGDGDVMMRFLPSFNAVALMGQGYSPTQAAKLSIKKIETFYPKYGGAIIALNKTGQYGAACYGFSTFSYSVASPLTNGTHVVTMSCK